MSASTSQGRGLGYNFGEYFRGKSGELRAENGMAMMVNLFHAVVGFLTPVEVSGRAFFYQKLRDFGVDTGALPPNCLNDFADHAINTGKNVARLTNKKLHHQVAIFVEG